MRCPNCDCSNTSVKDSRPREDRKVIRRRRVCDDCGYRFSTYETTEKPKPPIGYMIGVCRQHLQEASKTLDRLNGGGE